MADGMLKSKNCKRTIERERECQRNRDRQTCRQARRDRERKRDRQRKRDEHSYVNCDDNQYHWNKHS